MAKSFESTITICKIDEDGPKVNAKSIVNLLAEGITKGTKIEIMAIGTDEEQAVNKLIALIESGFGE